MVEHFMQNTRERQEQNYLQMYIFSAVIDKELLHEGGGGEQSSDNNVEEVSKVYLKKVSILPKRELLNKSVRNIAKEIISEVPTALEGLTKKVKNKKLRSILDSDITKTRVDLAVGYALDKLQ